MSVARMAARLLQREAVDMRQLKTLTLTGDRIDQCYPLWRLEHPDLTHHRWQDFASTHLTPGGPRQNGCLIVEDDQGAIHGLLIYRIGEDVRQGSVLEVDRVIIYGLFPSARQYFARALLAGIEHTALQHACASIRVTIDDEEGEGSWLESLLEDSGHRRTSLQYRKTLDQE